MPYFPAGLDEALIGAHAYVLGFTLVADNMLGLIASVVLTRRPAGAIIASTNCIVLSCWHGALSLRLIVARTATTVVMSGLAVIAAPLISAHDRTVYRRLCWEIRKLAKEFCE